MCDYSVLLIYGFTNYALFNYYSIILIIALY